MTSLLDGCSQPSIASVDNHATEVVLQSCVHKFVTDSSDTTSAPSPPKCAHKPADGVHKVPDAAALDSDTGEALSRVCQQEHSPGVDAKGTGTIAEARTGSNVRGTVTDAAGETQCEQAIIDFDSKIK